MAKKKTPVTVTIKASRAGGYTVSIDDPGNGPHIKLRKRYVSPWSAKRGAMRKLDARTRPSSLSGRDWAFSGGYSWVTPDGRDIVFK